MDDGRTAAEGFKRARTEEQKRQRMDDILDTADRLLDGHPYREVTMAMIAAELGYSRANLAHYVGTKEDIYLRLYLRDVEGLCADLAPIARAAVAEGSEAARIDAFAAALATAVARRRNFGRIGSMLSTVVETNVSPEQLAACKRRLRALVEEGARELAGAFPFLGDAAAAEFVMALTHFTAGLYPAAHPLDVQRAAMRAAGFPEQPFEPALRSFVVVQLHGWRALASATPCSA